MDELGDVGKPRINDSLPNKARGNSNREIIIPNEPGSKTVLNAFTSTVFAGRIKDGIRRLLRHKAESAFRVIASKQEIIYFPLDLGGRIAHDRYERYILGHVPAVQDKFTMPDQWWIEHGWSAEEYSEIGAFHFHPYYAPFSQTDIEIYDDLRTKAGKLSFKPALDQYEGVFMPKWKGETIPSITLFMFAGPPSNNFYQGVDFNRMSLNEQREVLERSGMKVVVADLPILGNRPDLTSLKEILK